MSQAGWLHKQSAAYASPCGTARTPGLLRFLFTLLKTAFFRLAIFFFEVLSRFFFPGFGDSPLLVTGFFHWASRSSFASARSSSWYRFAASGGLPQELLRLAACGRILGLRRSWWRAAGHAPGENLMKHRRHRPKRNGRILWRQLASVIAPSCFI